MGRVIRVGWAVCLIGAGCATAPPIDNPVLAGAAVENPVLVSPGAPTPAAYQEVFGKCVQIVGEYFDIVTPCNPYTGEILTRPRLAPGYEQFWKAGNPDPRTRLLATLQSLRHVATVKIVAGERGGYFVYVQVDLELEDLPRPTSDRTGGVDFEAFPTVARPWDVVNRDVSTDVTSAWFKVGRDYALEQELLRRIRKGE
jgi:hypothetical protein